MVGDIVIVSRLTRFIQVREDVEQMEYFYRHISKGAWPFSTRHHGWPISGTTDADLFALPPRHFPWKLAPHHSMNCFFLDCTAEGLKASLLLKQFR